MIKVLRTLNQIEKTNTAFRFFFSFSLLISVLGLNYVFSLGNTNAFERALLLIAAFFLFASNKKLSHQSFIGLLLITLSIFFFGAVTQFYQFSWARLLNAYLALLAILLFYVVTPNITERRYILNWIAKITPILIVWGFILFVFFGRSLYMRDHTGAMRFGGGTIPAYMAAASFSSAVAYAMLFRITKDVKFILMVFLCLIAVVLTGSRMPSVCAFFASLSIIFLSVKKFESKAFFVFLSIVLILAIYFTIGDQIMMRFESQSSSGRDKLWDSIKAWIDYYPWTGVGFGHHPILIPEYVKTFTRTQAVHSEYIRMAGELGYLGAAIFYIGLVMVFNGAFVKKTIDDYVLSFIVILSFGLFTYSDNTLLSIFCTLMPLAYAMGSGLDSKAS